MSPHVVQERRGTERVEDQLRYEVVGVRPFCCVPALVRGSATCETRRLGARSTGVILRVVGEPAPLPTRSM